MNDLLVTKLRITQVGNPSHWIKATPLIVQADERLTKQGHKNYVPDVLKQGTPTLFFQMGDPMTGLVTVAVLGKN